MADIVVVSAADLEEASPTPGMLRRDAQATAEVRVIELTTPPGSVSGWHHHADHVTAGYVLAGCLRLEWGPNGSRSIEAGPGSFFCVPPRTVLASRTRASTPSVSFGIRFGAGEQVVNVDGPQRG